MKTATIIGYGRFGKTIYRLIRNDFRVRVFDNDKKQIVNLPKDKIAGCLSDAYQSQIIFYCVPISQFEKIIESHQKFISSHLLIDVLSVKTYPKKIYNQYLHKSSAEMLLTHPMFGPDSSKKGFKGLPIVLDKFKTSSQNYEFFKKYFRSKGLKIIEMSAEEHDKTVAKSQVMTHLVGRVLNDFGYLQSPINTKGDKKIIEIIKQTCNDKINLFFDMQNKNPFAKNSRNRMQKSIDRVFKSIVKSKYSRRSVPIYGIQGGEGSFNDEAIHKYFLDNSINNYQIRYLHTTKRVLDNLDENEIDYGLFAVSNSRGGIVEETKEELGKHKFDVVDIINIPISHYIMGRQDSDISKIQKIMAHPQVFKQCEQNLAKKYSNNILKSGKGRAIDNARLAELLSSGKLGGGVAVMGSKRLADIYDLKILDANLQDDPHNTTNFVLVK